MSVSNKKPRLETQQQQPSGNKVETPTSLQTLLESSDGVQGFLCAHLNLADKVRLSTVMKSLYQSMNGNAVLWKKMDFSVEKGGKNITSKELRSLLDRTGACVEYLSLRGLELLKRDCGLSPLRNRAKNLNSIDLRLHDHDVSNGSAADAFDAPAVLEILQTVPSLEHAKFRWVEGREEDQRELTDIYQEPILSFVVNMQSKLHEKYIGKECGDPKCENKVITSIPRYHDMNLMECSDCKGIICPQCASGHCRRCNITLCGNCDWCQFKYCGAVECNNMFCGKCHEALLGDECGYHICSAKATCCAIVPFKKCGGCERSICEVCSYGFTYCEYCHKSFCYKCGMGVYNGRCKECQEGSDTGDYY